VSMNIEIFGWCGTLCQMIGILLNARKKISCWYVWLLSNVFLCVYSFVLNLWPVFVLNLVFVLFNIYGFRQWRKA